MTSVKLYPKCHPYWVIDGNIVNNRPVAMEHTNTGYLLPCCWVDSLDHIEELKSFGMLDESLKLDNNNSVKEIMLSKQWVNFHKILFEDQENAHSLCKKQCSEEPYE
jgi:hypothetical protein